MCGGAKTKDGQVAAYLFDELTPVDSVDEVSALKAKLEQIRSIWAEPGHKRKEWVQRMHKAITDG